MSTPHDSLPLLAAFFRNVLQASWQGSLAIVLVLIVRRILGARVPARWHYLLWFLVLARLLVPTFVLPHSPASLENIHAVGRPFERPIAAVPPEPTGDFIVAPLHDLSAHRVTPLAPVATTVGTGVRRHPWSWWELAAAAWLVGAVVLAGWLVLCSLRLSRRVRRELAADEWALRHLTGERSLAYGETLFKTLANRREGSSFQPGLVGISEDGAQMKQRLQRITAFLPRRHLFGSLAGLGALLVLATVVLGQSSSAPTGSPSPIQTVPSSSTSHDRDVKPEETNAPAQAKTTTGTTSPDAVLQDLADAILAAARAGNGKEVASLLHGSGTHFPLSAGNITQMLDDLLQRRELTAFTTLLEQAQQTRLGKDWKISDPLLTSLVKDGRTDFLDALLANGLAPERLGQQAKSAGPTTAEWITRRVAEETRRRADIEALEAAASNGDLPAMQRLVDAGADVNGVGKDHNTPLIRSVFKNRLEAAQWLLDHGAQVDKPRFPGWNYTPLCLVNSVPMAELLKRNGANVHAKLYSRDVSILTYVVDFAKPEVVEWFLQQGLDPKMAGDNNENLLFGLKDGRTGLRPFVAAVYSQLTGPSRAGARAPAESGE
jgi:hypothetical protein